MQPSPIAETCGPSGPSVRCFMAAPFSESVASPAGAIESSQAVFPLNLPNLLTVLRIMLVPVLVVALLGNTPAGDTLAAVVFVLASADGLRGRLPGALAQLHHHVRQADGPAGGQAAGGGRADVAGVAAPPRGVGGDGDHHARDRGHGAAAVGHSGGHRARRQPARQGQDVPADRRHPRGDRGARQPAVGARAAVRDGRWSRCCPASTTSSTCANACSRPRRRQAADAGAELQASGAGFRRPARASEPQRLRRGR